MSSTTSNSSIETSLAAALAAHSAPVGGAGASASDVKTQEVYQRSLKALEETLSYGVLTPQKIIPCTEYYGGCLSSLESLYTRLGPKLLTMIDFTTKTSSLRRKWEAKVLELDICTVLTVAVFAKVVKHGACMELGVLCSLSEHIKPLHCYSIQIKGRLTVQGPSDDHILILTSDTPLEPPCVEPFIPYVARQKNVCVIDPYLEKVVHSSEIEKEEEFKAQLLAMKNLVISKFLTLNKEFSTTFSDPKLIALEAYLHTIKDEIVEPPESVRSFLYTKRKELAVAALSAHAPGFSWKVSSSNQFWIKGDESALKEIKASLAAKGLEFTLSKISGKQEYCLFKAFANYHELIALCTALA